MVGEMVARFLLGGLVVSLFALFAEMCHPKTFAGIFGAAPWVALVTLMLAYHKNGPSYVAIEARSMVLGAVGLAVYSSYCVAASKTRTIAVWFGAVIGWAIWLVVSFGFFELVFSTGIFS